MHKTFLRIVVALFAPLGAVKIRVELVDQFICNGAGGLQDPVQALDFGAALLEL